MSLPISMEKKQPDIESISPHLLSQLNIDNPYLSARFKIWVAGLIFFLIFFHLFVTIAFPKQVILPKELILSVVLGLIAYLWAQEVRYRDRLQSFNNDLIQAENKLQAAEVNTMASLIRVEEANDVLVRGHSDRVARYAVAMAEAKEFSPATLETIRRAATLHDLGKLAIPDRILQKPSKLDEEEWKLIRRHPEMAVEILEPLKFLFLEKKIILHHHERIDGKGYPAGLKGAEIPLESRMIAIADTFDAMNSSRVYRESCSKEYILEELRRVSGTQLDATLIELFLKLLDANPRFWERN